METLYGAVKRDLPKCRSRNMEESPNSSLTAFCNGRYMVKGGSISSSNLRGVALNEAIKTRFGKGRVTLLIRLFHRLYVPCTVGNL